MGLLGSIGRFFTRDAPAPIAEPQPAPAPVELTKAARPPGTDGVMAYSGWLVPGEQNGALSGTQKWVTLTKAVNTAIVATGLRYTSNLLAGTEWHAEVNESGDPNAERGADIVTEGLLHAQMRKPWSSVIKKASLYRFLGFSLFATSVKRRPDGMIVYSAISHRPQPTIERWMRRDEQSEWDHVIQRAPNGKEYEIYLDEAFYACDDTLTDSPDGVGMLRHVVEMVRRLDLYQRLEGLAYESDLGGTPVARAPLAQLWAGTEGTTAQRTAAVNAATATVRNIIENRIKTPEALQYALLDSATYQGTDPNTISSIQKWAIELIKSETNGLAEIDQVVKRIEFQIARVLGIEFALVGAEGGSYSMHEDKTSMFATNLQVTLSELGSFATQQLARRLVRLNGLDPDTCTPTLVAEPISTDAIETVTRALMNLGAAGLQANDEAINVIRKRLRLPPAPEVDAALMMPRTGSGADGLDDDVPDDDDDVDADDLVDEDEEAA